MLPVNVGKCLPSIFFLSVLRPLVWPYPFIPLMNKTNKDYSNSPVPILASCLESEESSGNMYSKWAECGDNRIHVDMDNDQTVGRMLDVYLSKMLESQDLLKRLTVVHGQINQEQINFQKAQQANKSMSSLDGQSASRATRQGPDMLMLLSIQAVQLIRHAISTIYLKDFDKSHLSHQSLDMDRIKASILQKSKLDLGDHKRLLDTQMFEYLVERLHSNRLNPEDHLF